jgi:hypothetical protein
MRYMKDAENDSWETEVKNSLFVRFIFQRCRHLRYAGSNGGMAGKLERIWMEAVMV